MSTNIQGEQQAQPGQAIIVLGMHRSGTSAVAGALSSMGVNFGSREKLIDGHSEVNAKGFWEHRDIVMLNEQLLTAVGSSWEDIRDIDVKRFGSDEIHGIKESIKVVLKRDFSFFSLWGLKDPRICKLLPVWIDIFKEINVTPRFIIVYRHPEEVARSLEKRDSIPLEKAYVLWLSYVLASELFSRGFPRAFVAYDSLLDDWHRAMEKAFSDLSLPFDDQMINSHAIDSFLSPTLRHMVSKQESLKGKKGVWVEQLYHVLQHYSVGAADDSIIRNDIDQLRRNIRIAMSLFAPMLFGQDSACSEVGVLRREHSNLITDYEQSNAAYKQTKEAYKQTKEAYKQTKGTYSSACSEIEMLRKEYSNLIADYEQCNKAYEQTKEAYEQTKEAYEQTQDALDVTRDAYEQTQDALERSKEACEQTKSAFESSQKKLVSLQGKLSWRLCNKLGL